jgi:hypothetical protein
MDSPYRPGVRSGDWLKLKTADWKLGHAPRRHRWSYRAPAVLSTLPRPESSAGVQQ